MISIDEQPPPDPSSSSDNHNHQHHHQVSHEAFPSVSDIDLLKLTHDVNLDDTTTNNPLPRFSIRDYVIESRTKDLARNWPFSYKSLQLCLNYGVKNLLPPFQSLDSVRNYSSNDGIISNIDSKTNDDSKCHLEEELAHIKSISQPTVKKCNLVMKLINSGVVPVEETVAAASKVCPVCKAFSSSSNTTLNAHIDSCLSEESSMKWTANLKLKTVKHMIKPRKKRLIADVYKTAPHCTIEELDSRNGTNWATNSSFPDQEHEFQAEDKKKEPTSVPEVADHKGAVYIDKNGKKVRILSMLKLGNLDDDEARALQKRRKGSKVVIKRKKKAFVQKNGKKNLKLSPKNKRLSKKAESGQKENGVIKESWKKEDGGVAKNNNMDDLAITRPPWACSKRTGVAKKRFKRKEVTILDDSCENPVTSKGGTFSSLKKSLSMPASQEHKAGSKLVNLKRKFSAIEKSQDSLKQKSRTKEDSSKKMSFDMVDVMEVENKKSITSKSSNDESTSESAGTEHCIGIEPRFMGLKNSLDNEFDTRQCILDDIIEEHKSENQGSYFEEVDPILIPGPPGSFLPPSPGADMGSEEEPQGNSSLTTMSRVQSSEDYLNHDIMNQDFISGSSISTVSSPSFARTADKLSVRFDKKSVDNNNNNNDGNNTSDLRLVDAIFKEQGPTTCCCSKKEGAFFKNLVSYAQESALSKERATTESNGLTSEWFPLVNHLTLPPPEMVKSPALIPSTPVLRLMGKNLTVVNTDDDHVKPLASSPMGQYQQLHECGYPHQHHIRFNYNQNGSMTQLLNLYPPNESKSESDLRSATTAINATKEVIVIDDSSENEVIDNHHHHHHHHHHMFKEPMIRNNAFSFANPYGSGSLQTSSPLREVANDGNHGRWTPTAYYPRSFS